MKGWDFWNNPLVVSAMRLKVRRGSPRVTSSIYVVALLGVASLLDYVGADLPIPFGRAYLTSILAIQTALSGGIALFAVSASMTAEVANRTLDFQRIVSLSPRAIMLGKMIGEPTAAYLLAMTTIPFAVVCWYLGAASGATIAAMYLNLVSFTFFCSAFGLMHTLTPVESTQQKRRGSFAGLFLMIFFMLPSMLTRGSALLDNPWTATPLGLLTPVAALVGLANGDAWSPRIPLWEASVPSLVAAPLFQLALGCWIMAAMARRLRSIVAPPVTWRRAWGALALFDLLAASICYSLLGTSQLLSQRTAQFCIVHLLACVLLTITATPSREGLLSNIWRFRRDGAGALAGKHPNAVGWVPGRGQRAENTWLLVGLAAVGILSWGAWFAGPALLAGYVTLHDPAWGASLRHLAAMVVWLVSLGTAYQLVLALLGKSGTVWAFLVLAAVNIIPPVGAGILEELGYIDSSDSDLLLGLSPAAYYVTNQARLTRDPVSNLTGLGLYGIAGLACYRRLHQWIGRRKRHVANTLREMGCAPNVPSRES